MTSKVLGSLFLACMVLFAGAGRIFAQSNAAQAGADDKILTEYFVKNNIKATKTPSGMYYVIHKKGAGENAKPGQKVTMMYYGYTLDGKKFDANIDKDYNPAPGRTPFAFTLGARQVISGWDEGVQLLNKGCRATLYLPSALAYGTRGAGGAIPPNAVLAFDVEMVSAE